MRTWTPGTTPPIEQGQGDDDGWPDAVKEESGDRDGDG